MGIAKEIVRNGETGFICDTDTGFADAAIELLCDDELWLRQHSAAIRLQRSWRWPSAAAAFEALIP